MSSSDSGELFSGSSQKGQHPSVIQVQLWINPKVHLPDTTIGKVLCICLHVLSFIAASCCFMHWPPMVSSNFHSWEWGRIWGHTGDTGRHRPSRWKRWRKMSAWLLWGWPHLQDVCWEMAPTKVSRSEVSRGDRNSAQVSAGHHVMSNIRWQAQNNWTYWSAYGLHWIQYGAQPFTPKGDTPLTPHGYGCTYISTCATWQLFTTGDCKWRVMEHR